MVCVSAANTLFHSMNSLSEYVTLEANLVIDLNISQTAEMKIHIYTEKTHEKKINNIVKLDEILGKLVYIFLRPF